MAGTTAAVSAIVVFMASAVLAQGALAQLGLTETAARTFVLDEIACRVQEHDDRRPGIRPHHDLGRSPHVDSTR